MLTTKGGGSQPTPFQRRGPLAPYPVTGWIGDTLWWENKYVHLGCRGTWKLYIPSPEPDSNQMVSTGSYWTHEIPSETFLPRPWLHATSSDVLIYQAFLSSYFFLSLKQKIRLSPNWFACNSKHFVKFGHNCEYTTLNGPQIPGP